MSVVTKVAPLGESFAQKITAAPAATGLAWTLAADFQLSVPRDLRPSNYKNNSNAGPWLQHTQPSPQGSPGGSEAPLTCSQKFGSAQQTTLAQLHRILLSGNSW